MQDIDPAVPLRGGLGALALDTLGLLTKQQLLTTGHGRRF
jgi:hypothetical protein